jgi:hypothetical protein
MTCFSIPSWKFLLGLDPSFLSACGTGPGEAKDNSFITAMATRIPHRPEAVEIEDQLLETSATVLGDPIAKRNDTVNQSTKTR